MGVETSENGMVFSPSNVNLFCLGGLSKIGERKPCLGSRLRPIAHVGKEQRLLLLGQWCLIFIQVTPELFGNPLANIYRSIPQPDSLQHYKPCFPLNTIEEVFKIAAVKIQWPKITDPSYCGFEMQPDLIHDAQEVGG
jgi:hypothetical protein